MQRNFRSSKGTKAISLIIVVILAVVVVVGVALGAAFVIKSKSGTSSTGSLAPATITVVGSSLMYIAFVPWAQNFTRLYPSVTINVDAGGSGFGQQAAESGLDTIGASDAYLTNQSQAQYPWILNIPLAISAQQVDYNIPGLPKTIHLNFSASVLAGIYNGSISYWNDPQITSINPGAASFLTHNSIIPMFRADSSGDTFIFTQYLTDANSWWATKVGYGTTVSWPSNPSDQGQSGNSGMVLGLDGAPYSIGYVGISYLSNAVSLGLGYGYLQNRAGNFVNISSTNILADVVQFTSSVPSNERISMISGPGADSYPIVNFEYALVSKNQTSVATADALKSFLTWCASPTGGNSESLLSYPNFIALPSSVLQLTDTQIDLIQG